MIRDTENFTWTNILTFLHNLKNNSLNNRDGLYQLQIDKKDASSNLHSTFSQMFEEEKEYFSKILIGDINKIFHELHENQLEEKEYLKSFRKEVRSYLINRTLRFDSTIPKIFKNGDAFDFFLETLFDFDMIDNGGNVILINNKPIRGLQALATAIRENKYFQSKIFTRPPELKKYVEFFKDHFNITFNPEKMSEAGKYKDLLQKFIIDQQLN